MVIYRFLPIFTACLGDRRGHARKHEAGISKVQASLGERLVTLRRIEADVHQLLYARKWGASINASRYLGGADLVRENYLSQATKLPTYSHLVSSPAPEPPDLTYQLPRDIYYQIVHTLRGALPPPITASDEDLAHRDNAAIGAVACLLPANAEEADLAAQFVAANAQAMECLRLARVQCGGLSPWVLRCTAQSANMMRQARGARSLLLRVQPLVEARGGLRRH